MRNQTSQSGFSLVEMIIYVSILSVMSVAAVTFMLSLQDLFKHYRVQQELFSAGTITMERILTEIRTGDEVVLANTTLDDGANGALQIDGDTTTTFTLTSGEVIVDVDGVTEGSLTPGSVTVNSFTVHHYDNTLGEMVRVILNMTATVDGYSDTYTLYGGGVVRGSYD